MRRWWLVLGLLLSVGVNAGVLATLAVHRWETGKPAETSGAEKAFTEAPQPAKPPVAGPRADKPIPPLPNVENAPQGEPQRIVRLADRLGLEGEQRRRFIRLQGSFFAETLRLRTEQAETQRELRRALAAPRPDQPRIESLLQESGRTFLALEKAMAENVMSSRRLLNPQQEREFLRLVANLRPFGGGGGGLGGGQGQRKGAAQGLQNRQQLRQEILQELRQEQRQRMLEQRRQRREMGLGPEAEPNSEDRPPGRGVQRPAQGQGQPDAGPPFRPRRPGLLRQWNRRLGGQGNRPGAAETPPADTPSPADTTPPG